MWKLIRLEWKKNNIRKYILKAVVVAVILGLFIFAFAYLGIARDPDTGRPDAVPGKDTISTTIELFTSMCYLILTSVMLSSFIVGAYKDKTMDLMFSYPIKRQKILLSQILAVWLFAFVALVLTKLFLYGCIRVGSLFLVSDFPLGYHLLSLEFYVQLLIKAVVTITMGFIALFVGLAMKSSKATIVTSFLLIFLTQANIGDITLSNQAAFPLLLTGISLLFMFLSIYKVEQKDLM